MVEEEQRLRGWGKQAIFNINSILLGKDLIEFKVNLHRG